MSDSRDRSPVHATASSRHDASPTRKRERDRDRSPSPKRIRRSRSRSKSPRRSPLRPAAPSRFAREAPQPDRCLGMFGLPPSTDEGLVRGMCEACDGFDSIHFIYDRQTNKMKGFCFVYFKSVEDAAKAKEKLHGKEVDGRPIRVDFSVTKKAHSPTPGVYMGTRLPQRGMDRDRRSPRRDRDRSPRYDDRYRRRSRSPSRDYDRDRRDRYRDRRARSRSRSRSRDRYRR